MNWTILDWLTALGFHSPEAVGPRIIFCPVWPPFPFVFLVNVFEYKHPKGGA